MQKQIIVALDFPSPHLAMDLVHKLDPALCRLKVGKELFVRAGPQFVETLMRRGFDVFLDLKFHDIPNTVAGACEAAAELGVWMVNVHASGGEEMLIAAENAIAQLLYQPILIGVTILTSLDDKAIAKLGYHGTVSERVDDLAKLSADCGLNGVVCSAYEAGQVQLNQGSDFLRITPGIKFAEAGENDQKRVMTPAKAIQNGASFLVMGRAITEADDPIAALERANDEIKGVLK